MILASFSVVSGVCSDGLMTMVLPPARAGRELPRRHHQRIVPRRDRADDADRVAADHRGVARHVLARHGAMHVAHGAGEEAEAVGDRRHLVLQHADPRLAAIQRLERGERLGIAVDGVGELQQQRRALGGRRARPGLERLRGGFDRSVDLRRRGVGEADDRLLGLGIDHGSRAHRCRQRNSRQSTCCVSSMDCPPLGRGLPAISMSRRCARLRASDNRRRGSAASSPR